MLRFLLYCNIDMYMGYLGEPQYYYYTLNVKLLRTSYSTRAKLVTNLSDDECIQILKILRTGITCIDY